jgi:hypothetical protein
MVFWFGILIAVAFAASSLKLGLYHAWTMFFNILIAVYMGVRLGPFIQDFIPAAADYNTALAILGAALGSFLILHGISYVFLIGQFDITFPSTINKFGSAFLGFLVGFLVWSFIFLLVCATPFSQNKFVKDAGVSSECFEHAHCQAYLVWWCSAMDKLVGSSDADAGQTVAGLLFKPAVPKTPAPMMPNKRVDVNEPNLPGAAVKPVTAAAQEPNETLPP